MDPLFEKAELMEYKIASYDLSRSQDDVEDCTLRSYKRYDDTMARIPESISSELACKAGCSYCCYFKVEVRAHELFLIKRYLKNTPLHHDINIFLKSARSNSESIRTLSRTEHFGTNFKCPFLIENRCRIYPVRPYACRNFHATNPYNCKLSYENPTNLSIPDSFIPELHSVGSGHKSGYEKALEKRGFDMRVYDMNTAFIELYAEDSSRKRYLKGKRSFLNAILVDVKEILDK